MDATGDNMDATGDLGEAAGATGDNMDATGDLGEATGATGAHVLADGDLGESTGATGANVDADGDLGESTGATEALVLADGVAVAVDADGDRKNGRQRKEYSCSFCKMIGHRKTTCVLNPASKRFITPSNSQLSESQPTPAHVPATQVTDRTQALLQELRQTCGTSTGSKKKRKGKLPSGLGCFVAESGWTCYDPNTPGQRVIDVPDRRKSKRLMVQKN